MGLAKQFTKIVCTIGPASRRPEVLEQLMAAGMNVARLNFSHGEFSEHARLISAIRAAAARLGKDVAIMADLPGPKMRVGELADEPVELQSGDDITLTTEEIVGSRARLSVSFAQLPAVVRPGNVLFLNDGIVQLEVRRVAGREVSCRVLVGVSSVPARVSICRASSLASAPSPITIRSVWPLPWSMAWMR